MWLVDTNIILDIIGADSKYGEKSRMTLAQCAETGILFINPIIYAEVGAMIDSIEELDELLPTSLFHREPLPWEAAYLAGQAFVRYKRRGGTKKRILADFLIGAHATVAKMKIISRDAGYSRYFTVEVLNPAAQGK
ncbi:MAG: type II toxin-antitoxin system VapC family toxin [Desulfobulbaceae bacterium]|nr:type II toxin-antitoxin system VapC family toxin [Desulfobulbaceae bacterium]